MTLPSLSSTKASVWRHCRAAAALAHLSGQVYIPGMRSRLFLAAVLVTALLAPAAGPWCATHDNDRMPCCRNGVRCDPGMRAGDCCGVAPIPATPLAPVSLAAAPTIDRHHDGTGMAVAVIDDVLPAFGTAAGIVLSAGPPRARTTPLHILNTSLLC